MHIPYRGGGVHNTYALQRDSPVMLLVTTDDLSIPRKYQDFLPVRAPCSAMLCRWWRLPLRNGFSERENQTIHERDNQSQITLISLTYFFLYTYTSFLLLHRTCQPTLITMTIHTSLQQTKGRNLTFSRSLDFTILRTIPTRNKQIFTNAILNLSFFFT